MEFELFNEGVQDDYAFGAEHIDNEQLVFEGDEGQRCGICMDIVVDRGVLDCCQHWFCFTCIDNWASITNLCPLCQNEFQLITCVPVYDTVGGIQLDDGSYLRDDDDDDDDDDWSVEGNNNTLSFPSYYIDENAVSCLDGDSCKIRGQSANLEEDPDLDTSIACDSCDLWYHAICVGFDPDGTCENSWLCPRCLVDERLPKSEVGPSNYHGPESSRNGHLVDANFPMNVSVSVADAGETAVVVSIIDRNQQSKVQNETMLSNVNTSTDLKIGNQEFEERNQVLFPASNVCEDDCKLEKQLDDKIIKKPKIEAVELDISLLQGTTSTLASEPSQPFELTSSFKEETNEPSVSDGLITSKLYDENSNNKSLESGFHRVSSVGPLSDKDEANGEAEKKKVSKVCRLPAEKNLEKKDKSGGITGAKRKQRDCSVEEVYPKTKIQNNISAKIVKTERSRVGHSIDKANSSGGGIVRKPKVKTDISEIVQGTYRRPSNSHSGDKPTPSGLRIKKIMRRATEDKDSLVEVQSLRKEIRDAIRNCSSKDLENNIFDPKLLAAFRTALAGQTTETKRPPPLDVKAKKALLQKGTVRENLTKKIYGIGGKRKRAWTRDCEIEFWKHRCSKVSKPEKIETLKSVLDLLRKGPDVMEVKKENTVETRSSILSRLYVADSSVFPRKADIKPLSSLNGKSPDIKDASVQSSDDCKETKVAILCEKGEPASRRVNPSKSLDQPSRSTGGSLINAPKEAGSGSTGIKVDKKKWAMEVLARKTAVSGNNSSQGHDNAVLKGNYPLLAKLPADMRPSLAPSRHNKIPISIRQAQLYRLTEHFLKKTNMPVTRPTAEIELAVADAINVEKAVADKSNSKLVYVNLCSQELLHRSDNVNSTMGPDSEPAANPKTETNPKTGNDDHPSITDLDVDEALRNAGLLSDSPPDSPHQHDTEPDNVFEIDSQPELDIYGDFEYDLEEEDYIGSSAIKTSKVQQDETKIKMVFSTLDHDKSDSGWGFEDHEVENDNTKQKSPSESKLHEGGEDEIFGECEELYGPDKEPLIKKSPETKLPDLVTENNVTQVEDKQELNLAAQGPQASELSDGIVSENLAVAAMVNHSSGGIDSPKKPLELETKEKKSLADKKQQPDKPSSVFKKVEAYIKEHIRPLCKSGVITVEQYRWAVGKTTDKIMKYHSKDTNANFLIKEGEKVKKLAEQYVESSQKLENNK